ncbi:DUF4377 domain-containing protein [Psychrobacter sp. GP33]|uniref:DUF4377 domain-containing protein n=1 Tax=Psychrobacter sp. GP33 TaxID=2758709 RepID=UPI0015F97FAB|nr:DUF4377 domain-containing protein [Psychrobacter sp. GP33]
MKKLLLAALVATFTLAGCSTTDLVDERAMVVEGQAVTVKVINIPSLEVEIAPRKAICEMTDSAGMKVEAECLQYRQTYQRNFNTLTGNIQGFTYEPNFRYVLDVRQEAVADTTSGVVKPVWILNKIISKTAE